MSLQRGAIACSCGCIIPLTSSPWVLYFMCSCVLLSSGRFGPLRAEVGVGLRRVRLVQALLSSPPSAGLVPLSVGLRFSFLLPFQGFPFRARCVVLVFSLSLFSCVPLYASWLSIFHFIFIVIFIFISSAPLRWGVCVCTICIDVKLQYIAGGRGAHVTSSANEAE